MVLDTSWHILWNKITIKKVTYFTKRVLNMGLDSSTPMWSSIRFPVGQSFVTHDFSCAPASSPRQLRYFCKLLRDRYFGFDTLIIDHFSGLLRSGTFCFSNTLFYEISRSLRKKTDMYIKYLWRSHANATNNLFTHKAMCICGPIKM